MREQVHKVYTQVPIPKMSQCQTKAGNQECQSLNVIENYQNIENGPQDMLNKFCFHVHAQKSLFIGENANAFLTSSTSREFRCHRAGSQLIKISLCRL